jgi:asparagine synthase (glutamine-hydrolysing)
MCGISGIYNHHKESRLSIKPTLNKMNQSMLNRGPDARGIWIDHDANFGIAHTRLSIIDLSNKANQPMISSNGRFVIAFNGEIYNFCELKTELERQGQSFKTNSDTEVILNLFLVYKHKMLSKLRGMFAIAIWDIKTQKLFLARDPYGIKPLYIAKTKNGWIFSSQVRAILETNNVAKDIDETGIDSFELFGNVIEPFTWFRSIRSIPSGSWVEINKDLIITSPQKYWDIEDSWVRASKLNSRNFNRAKIINETRKFLIESVKYHLVSDVRIGILLSAGIDSTILLSLIKELGLKNVLAITVQFDEFWGTNNDESVVAAEVASYFGVEHFIRRVTKGEFESDIESITLSMDQPSIDGVNTWYACKAASEKKLKVVLSGVGADEIFFGYPAFKQITKIFKIYNYLKNITFFNEFLYFISQSFALITSKNKWRDLPLLISSIDGLWFAKRSITSIKDFKNSRNSGSKLVKFKKFNLNDWILRLTSKNIRNAELRISQLESVGYLRNQLLRDSDWASMAHSIELRTPFVDAHLLRKLEPFLSKFKFFPNKELLIKSSNKKLPDCVLSRKKTGFNIPVEKWFSEIQNKSKKKWPQKVAEMYVA